MTDQSAVKRRNGSFTAPLESKVLKAVATHLPAWVTPDGLTLVGIAGSILTFVGYCAASLSRDWLALASLGLVLNWLGDSLDGTLARHRQQERHRYGFFVDHTADLISQVLTGVGLALSDCIKAPTALLLLTAYLTFVGFTFIRMRVFGVLQIAFFSVGPTEVRLMLIVMNAALFAVPWLSRELVGVSATPCDLASTAMAIVVYACLIVQMFTDWRKLVSEERSDPRESGLGPAESGQIRRRRYGLPIADDAARKRLYESLPPAETR